MSNADITVARMNKATSDSLRNAVRRICHHVFFFFDVLTSNISFIRLPNTEKCDVTANNVTHQSANSRRGHMT